MTTQLYYNVASQSIYFDCPEGRPSSVTSVAVYPANAGDDATAETATTGSASVETNPNTTFDASAAVGAKTLPIAATTGVAVGRTYLITNSTSEKEWVEVREINTDVSVVTRNPIANAYASSDTFQSTRISISILDAWAATESKISDDLDPNPGYRVRWVYVVSSTTYVHDSYFDLVRYRAEHDVSPLDVDSLSPGWMDRLPTHHRQDQGRKIIDQAYEEVKFDLHMSNIPAEMLRNRTVERRLIMKRAIMLLQQMQLDAGRVEVGPALEDAHREYDRIFEGLIKVVNRTSMSVDAEGAGGSVIATSLLEK